MEIPRRRLRRTSPRRRPIGRPRNATQGSSFAIRQKQTQRIQGALGEGDEELVMGSRLNHRAKLDIDGDLCDNVARQRVALVRTRRR